MLKRGDIIRTSDIVLNDGSLQVDLNADSLDGYSHEHFVKIEHASLVGVGGHIPSGGDTSKFLRGDGTWAVVATTDTNNYPTSLTGGGNGVITLARSGLTSLTLDLAHTHTFASLTSKPTTISGFGITDAFTKTEVDAKISALVNGAGTALDTLKELADALGNDPNFATTVTTSIGTKLNKAGDTMTGGLTFSSSATGGVSAASPTALSYGKLHSYGNLLLLANTDGTGDTEYVLIGAGVGITPTTAQGLKIGQTHFKWKDNDVWHAGNFTPSSKLDASANAVSASKWSSPITITVNGAVTGSVQFDGSNNPTLTTTVNHNHDSDYVKKVGDTITGNIDIVKSSPTLRLFDNNTSAGSYPSIIFDDGNNQGTMIQHNEHDGELSQAGFGIIIKKSPNNNQANKVHLQVEGEIYANMSSKVWHSGNFDPNTKLNTSGGTISGALTVSGKTQSDGGFKTGDFEIVYNSTEKSLDFVFIG